MDLNQIPNDSMINGLKIGDKKVGNFDDVVDNELDCCRVKIDPEKGCRKVEEERLALELEIWNKYLKLEAIKKKIRVLGDEKLGIEEEIKGLKRKKAVLGGAVEVGEVSSKESDEMSRLGQLLVESKVLECEKNGVNDKEESWEQRYKDLGLRMLALLERLKSKDKVGGEGGLNGATTVKGDHVCALKEVGAPSCLPGAIDGEMPIEGTPDKPYVVLEDSAPTKKARLKKRLDFEAVRCCHEKIAPPTPEDGKPSAVVSVVDIIDSDNEGDFHANRVASPLILTPNTKRKRDFKVVTSDDECEIYGSRPNRRALKIENRDNEGEEDDDESPIIRRVCERITCESDDESPIIRRVCERITCESDDEIPIIRRVCERITCESDDEIPIIRRVCERITCESDDEIPLCILLKRRAQQGLSQSADISNPIRPKRRLVKRGQSEQKDKAQVMDNNPDTLETDNAAYDEPSDDDSESSVRSLSSFIVDDEDVEDGEDDMDVEDDVLDGDESFEMDEGSDDNLDFEDIIFKLQSRRHPNSKWTSEGDMLSDFAKNPELCLRAVCALYRQQTNEEKACKASIVNNGRGFSKFDATRGTRLGEFLTDGDRNGDLVKSVEELKVHHPNGLEECRRLADHYSKQLFKIYETGEDPFFP